MAFKVKQFQPSNLPTLLACRLMNDDDDMTHDAMKPVKCMSVNFQ